MGLEDNLSEESGRPKIISDTTLKESRAYASATLDATINMSYRRGVPIRAALLRQATNGYFKPRRFEREGTVYEMLGVRKLQKACVSSRRKRLVKTTGSPKPGYYSTDLLWDRSFCGLIAYECMTRCVETISTVCAVGSLMGVAMSIYLTGVNYETGMDHKTILGLATLDLALFVANSYVSMAYRYCRGRIYNTLENKIAHRWVTFEKHHGSGN